MKSTKTLLLLSLVAATVLPGCGDTTGASERSDTTTKSGERLSTNVELAGVPPTKPEPAGEAPLSADGTREIEWDALIPDDFRPDKLMADYAIDELSDDDPRAAEMMEKLRELWDQAPVRTELDGAQVKLPGFIVPVEADEKEATGFLLVPYYGACIHVPPPPANQTVYVVTEAGKGAKPELFDVVWVTGTMSVKRIENDIAEAGYTLYASEIAPYE